MGDQHLSLEKRKDQRLSFLGVHPSGWKWRAPRKEVEDIVSTSIER